MFRSSMKRNDPDPWKGICSGLAGGIVGSLVMTAAQMGMGRLMSAMEARKSGEETGKEEREMEQGEEPATVKAASVISEKVFHHELGNEEKRTAGQAVHYGVGTTFGLAYGLAAEYAPKITRGLGAPFGAGLMTATDEIALPVLRLSPPPTRLPASVHVYALAAHLVYGMACELARRQVRRLLH